MIFGHDAHTPCFDDPYPYDVLVDQRSGPEYALALLEASEMCASCPVRAVCHAENAGEPWVEPIAKKLRGEFVRTQRRGSLAEKREAREYEQRKERPWES